MKKRLFNRAAAFAVASLMAIGVITVLPDGCLPQIGAVISAEEAEAGGVAINETNFPDDVFRQYILRFDSDSDDFLSNEEINQITVIDLLHGDVQTFKGIEYFTSLTRLLCAYNQLTSLDVSNNTALTYLECQDNQLTSLDVSNNTALTYLRCHGNKITSLDVSNNTLLTHLYCSYIQLTSLNVSNNTALIELGCSQNKLSSLDVSNNTMLEHLDCSDNLLTSLNVNNNTSLTYLRCDDNQLTSLDVSNNTELTYLGCSSNQLTSLDVSNNTALTTLGCSSNQLTSLDVSNNTALILLNCLRNKLTSLGVSNNTALTTLHCDGNKLTSLDVSNNTHLEDFRCYENQLMSLDVSNNIALRYLMCDRNKLTTLDVSNNTALTVLSCESNQLASLDVSNNALITQLICDDNVYNIGETCGTYDLKNLPTDFNITKTSNWQGATLKDGKLTEIDGTGTITYDYGCGNSHTATFSLIYDYAEHSYDDGIITIEPTEEAEGEKTYTCTNCGATKTEPTEKLENADGIEINSVNFPDEIFKQYVSDNFDKNNNGLLSNEEISQVTRIDVDDKNIQSLKGIEYFTELTNLYCDKNKLTSLDIGQNTKLEVLCCSKNQLTSLDINSNTLLEYLWCDNNKLTSLNLSNNKKLGYLWCGFNELTLLDVSNNTVLTFLSCEFNKLISLDVSKNIALKDLYCEENQLTSLDVSKNAVLEDLVLYYNEITSLDVSKNTALIRLDCKGNQLTSLNVSNNTALTSFYCNNNSCNIGETCGMYDLKNLPAGFDITKASNWQGATLKDDMLTGIDGTISYDYDCGNNHTATFKLTYDLVDHTYDDGIITTEPTEDTEGEKTYTCTNCGATKTEPIEKLEHVHKQDDELMSDATGHWYTCSGCTEKLDFATHTEDSGTVTVEPTEATEGQKVYTCTVCGYTTRTDVVAKLEHVHNKGTELVSDGTGHWYTCGSCDEKLDFATHTEDNGTVTLAPTVTTEGQRVYKCTVCSYTTRTETIAKLENGNTNPSKPSQPTTPTTPTNPTNPTNPTTPQQPATSESDTIISAKNGWGNVVKQINAANENSKITVDMGNTTNVPKNVMNAIKGKNIYIVLDMGDGITWTINGKDVTSPQSLDFSVTKKKNSIPQDMISDPDNTIPLVLAHNGNFGCSATLSIELGDNNNKKVANLYYYNSKTKELEFVDSSEIVNGKANLVFTHASDWAIVISDISAQYEDVSSAAGVYEADDNSQSPLYMIVIIIAIAAVGFSSIIIVKRFAKKKH